VAAVRRPALLILLSASACGTQPPEVELREPDQALPLHLADLEKTLLALHNRERAAVGARPLVWDARLAAAAAAYGPKLAGYDRLVHSGAEARPGQGENLWKGTHQAYAVERMFAGWANEKRLFRPGLFPMVSTTGKWLDVGHYTQIVWQGTERVGCAVHQTARWDYLICRYSPPGNVSGRYVP
jgi:hypothetical protein